MGNLLVDLAASSGTLIMEGDPAPKPNFFIELCELVHQKVPTHALDVTESPDREKMYWRELYRWVEIEEMYDHVIGEFSPPEITRLDYRAIRKFQAQLKQKVIRLSTRSVSLIQIF
ncbi:unnamed protein product [Dibothriocephalus latus]|uniref:Uncharacterized protein n=1 Tax=Dibothriocephalus latus TaxID=60516 RepID=A0A3P6T070_DIBLA|nr:unnamed protein product [Dibothriocephalus latus]